MTGQLTQEGHGHAGDQAEGAEQEEMEKLRNGRVFNNSSRHRVGLLMRHKDLEGRDEVRQSNRLVRLPLLVRLCVIDEDNVVVLLALVVDLDLGRFSSSHDGGFGWCFFGCFCLVSSKRF